MAYDTERSGFKDHALQNPTLPVNPKRMDGLTNKEGKRNCQTGRPFQGWNPNPRPNHQLTFKKLK